MKIQGKFTAEVVGFQSRVGTSDAKTSTHVDLELALDHKEIGDRFGKAFSFLAKVATSTIPVNVICEILRTKIHEIREFNAQPRLLAVRPVEASTKVLLELRIPISDQDVGLELLKLVGKTVTFELESAQLGIAFPDPAKGNGHAPSKSKKAKPEGAEAH